MTTRRTRACARRFRLAIELAAIMVAVLFLLPMGTFSAGTIGGFVGSSTLVHPAASSVPAPFRATIVKSSADDWPELHQVPDLKGFASNSPLTSTNASKLGVAWATNLYGSALDSPVVAYDPLLGETLAYVGTETGNVVGVNLVNGQIVWGTWLGSPIRSTPLIYNGSLYVGTFINPTLFKLNATTGTTEASVVSPRPFEATPTIATPPGGVATLYIGTVDTGPGPGPFLAYNANNLSLEWKFTGYNVTAGSWDSAAYAVSASGVPMVVFGTDNPDSSIYDLNALTGTLIWRFQTDNPNGGDYDVASGPTISPPGANGFPQGVVYAVNKIAKMYALDLNNGTLIWETNFNALAGATGVARSTPALDGTNVIFGYTNGLVDLNAKTGAKFWIYNDSTDTESIASPALAGGHGTAIAVTGDVGGFLDVVSVVGGSPLYSYSLGGYVTASPAVSGGNIVIATAGGYLYDFAVGGGNDAVLPTTTITTPTEGSTLANPAGDLTVNGSATDSVSVAAVEVAVQLNGVGGAWWDAATGTWSPGPIDNPATLHTPGAKSTTWSLAFPVPSAGATVQVFANTVSSSGQSDLTGSDVEFVVDYNTKGPHLEVTPSFAAPGGTVTVNGGGFGPSQKVSLQLLGAILANLTSHANGSFPSTRVAIPLDAAFGLAAITGVGKNASDSSSAAITITNNWDQFGYDPGHSGYEPNDGSLNYLIFPGGNNWVRLAWHFDPGTPIDSSPAVSDGVAYVADTAGQLFAVDTHNGGLLWTFTLASGAALDGSPAVDPALGLVFVGANDGTLYAVRTANGTLAWSVNVTGDVRAPLYSNGDIIVTSSTGVVKSVVEMTGVVQWTHNFSGQSLSGPAYNASSNLVVVGESNGNVVAMNASTGSTLWSYATGAPVDAAATVYGGVVYVGSNSDRVYALKAATGALIWSYKTGGYVQDTGSLSSNLTNGALTLFIGSNDGNLYALKATTGAELFLTAMGSPIVGVSTAKGIAVFETGGGTISATRSYVAEDGWHYKTGGSLTTAPVLLDGAIYVCATNGNLYAFTPTGAAPA
jgi:outer membrane protein assembly factor BamB